MKDQDRRIRAYNKVIHENEHLRTRDNHYVDDDEYDDDGHDDHSHTYVDDDDDVHGAYRGPSHKQVRKTQKAAGIVQGGPSHKGPSHKQVLKTHKAEGSVQDMRRAKDMRRVEDMRHTDTR